MPRLPSVAAEARDILGFTAGSGLEILALLRVIERSNEKSIWRVLNKRGAGSAARVVQHSLFTRLVVWVTRSYATSRPGDKHAQRAVDILSTPEVQEEIADGPEWTKLNEALTKWRQLRGDVRRKRIDHYRDKKIAHLGTWDIAIPTPIFGDVLRFSRETGDCMIDLALSGGVIAEKVDDRLAEYDQSAVEFWRPWQ